MGLLLDTHVLIWLFSALDKVPRPVKERIGSGEVIFVSFASAWEYGIKRGLQREEYATSFPIIIALLPHRELPCTVGLGRYAETLPPIHKDPFDRMLVAQAIEHRLTLVTSDAIIHKYPVETFW